MSGMHAYVCTVYQFEISEAYKFSENSYNTALR